MVESIKCDDGTKLKELLVNVCTNLTPSGVVFSTMYGGSIGPIPAKCIPGGGATGVAGGARSTRLRRSLSAFGGGCGARGGVLGRRGLALGLASRVFLNDLVS